MEFADVEQMLRARQPAPPGRSAVLLR